jgi:dUTP pyrophosphatase
MTTIRVKTTEDIYPLYRFHEAVHEDDSGIDLFTPQEYIVPANALGFTINFQLRCEPPCSFWLIPRSSISKTPLRMANGIGLIDKGYRGELMAKVDNMSSAPYKISASTRLFQICLPTLEPLRLEIVNELSETSRGDGGFGSTALL